MRHSAITFLLAAAVGVLPALMFGPLLASRAAAAEAPPLGVFTHGKIPKTEPFADLVNMPVTLWMSTVPWNKGWTHLEAAEWQFAPIARWLRDNPDKNVVLSYPPFPTSEGRGAPTLAKCAAGAFNPHYEAFARRLRDVWQIDRLILRFGWEWNGNWYPWGVSRKPEIARDFAACFRQFVETVDRTYPGNHFVYDWNPVQDASPALLAAGWPGADHADVVGIDVYDQYWKSWGGNCDRYDFDCRWRVVRKQIDRIAAFAQQHDTPISFPEWGIWGVGKKKDDGRGGGDNPVFIEGMCKYIRDPSNRVAYSAYFNADAEGDHRLETHPKALAAFRRHCQAAPRADLGHGIEDGL